MRSTQALARHKKAGLAHSFVGKRPLWRGRRPDGGSCWRIGLKSNPGRDVYYPYLRESKSFMIGLHSVSFSPLLLRSFVSLLSAWLPVRRASRLPIKDVVYGTGGEERHIPRQWTAAAGARSFTASILLPRLTSGNTGLLSGRGDCPSGDDCRCNTRWFRSRPTCSVC